MSLPLAWVERIFEKLIVTYGSTFLARWKDVDIGMVKTDWCHELSNFEKAPHAIAFALANLPERPPSVIEFKNLCRQAPSQEAPALPMPAYDPVIAKMVVDKLRPTIEAAKHQTIDHKAWARKHLAEHAAGVKKNPTVLQMARNALGADSLAHE